MEVGAAGSGRGRGHGNCKVTVDSDFHSLGRFNGTFRVLSAAGETPPGQWEPEPEPAADSEARPLASSETSKPDRRDQEERHWHQSRDGT